MHSTDLDQIFQEKKDQTIAFINKWKGLRQEFIDAFGKERVSILAAVEALDKANDEAHQELLKKLDHPTVSIATTGTTSSGKSTVVNLLCGHQIMPVATGEMSAGVVTISHDPGKRFVRVPDTPEAQWECGEWDNQSDTEIHNRLRDIMELYNTQRGTPDSPSCPQIEVTFPVRIAMDSNDAGIPAHFAFQVMDLPGLKFIGDKGNMDVIKKCRNSLCLVTYNSDDTDDRRQSELLSEVVDQVKSLGGTPARMLFILNRIDAFRRDDDWKKSENKFVNELHDRIKTKLLEALPEYTKDLENVNIIKLSSLPAYLSLALKYSNDDEMRNTARKINRQWCELIPDNVFDDLPKSDKRWSEKDKERVSEALWETSYGNDFQKHLKDHIAEHLPELVIPQIVDEFRNKLAIKEADEQDCVVWSIQTITAEMNSSDEKYKAACSNLEVISHKLDEQRKKTAEKLLQPFNKITEVLKPSSSGKHLTSGGNSADVSAIIRQILKGITYGSIKENDLEPLYQWMDLFTQTASRLFEEIAEPIDKGEPVKKGKFFSALPETEQETLKELSLELIKFEYKDKQSTQIETKQANKKQLLKGLNATLKELANCLTVCMEKVMEKKVSLEKDRIYGVMRKVSQSHVHKNWFDAKKVIRAVVPDLDLGFLVPPISLVKAQKDFAFEYKFEAGFDVIEKSRKEFVRNIKKLAGTESVKTGEERVWYKLWLGTRDVYQTRKKYTSESIYETRQYDVAYIPAMDEIVVQWAKQFYIAESEMLERFTDWLTAQIDELNKSVEKAQKDIVKKYKKKIDAAYEDAKKGHDVEMSRLKAMLEKANDLNSTFKEMTNLN